MPRLRLAPSGVVVAALGAVAIVSAIVPHNAAAVPVGVGPNYLRDFQTVQTQTPASTLSPKTVFSNCPPGKIALGTGGSIASASGFPFTSLTGVGLQRMRAPSTSGRGTIVRAVEADPQTPPWLLAMQSQCAAVTSAPPGAATGGPYLKDVTTERTTSAFNSDSPKQLAVGCGGGRQSIGGGFATGFLAGVGAVSQAVRVEGGFRVRAQETDPTSRGWQLHVVALCANLTRAGQSYLADVSTHEKLTALDSKDFKVERVDCPEGQRGIGGGAELLGTAGAPPPPDVTLVSSNPDAGRERYLGGYHAAAGEEDPTAESWQIRVRAICARIVTPPTVSPE